MHIAHIKIELSNRLMDDRMKLLRKCRTIHTLYVYNLYTYICICIGIQYTYCWHSIHITNKMPKVCLNAHKTRSPANFGKIFRHPFAVSPHPTSFFYLHYYPICGSIFNKREVLAVYVYFRLSSYIID